MSRHEEPTVDVPLSGAEIAGFMNWRGPGAYTAHAERRVVRLIAEAVRRERVLCAYDDRDKVVAAWRAAGVPRAFRSRRATSDRGRDAVGH